MKNSTERRSESTCADVGAALLATCTVLLAALRCMHDVSGRLVSMSLLFSCVLHMLNKGRNKRDARG